MSLDVSESLDQSLKLTAYTKMTTLQVLMKTGTEKQRKQAAAIIPIRKDGHLLLISLIIANMLINEILPLLAENVFGGGIQAVVASTALIVIFAEIIPQSVCTRFGLQIGARMVLPVRALIILFYVVAKPASMLLTRLLGSHSGMIYRRAELKELVALHQLDETGSHRGGDLQPDTVQIVGTALDFQEKSVADAMTPIANVFMLDLNTTKLDYEVLGRVLQSGHSRIPVYEEIQAEPGSERLSKKIVGVILTKQFILLDPEDAVPLKDLPIHPVPIVCENVPLHTILNSA
jgi:CBS domain containing-hemolysin-like protein